MEFSSSYNETSPLIRSNQGHNVAVTHIEPQNEGVKQSSDDDAHQVNKLNTFNGVFVPTALNVLSILMFLRFGFILGQMGITGSLFLLVMSYTIDLLTTLSISAISTNGTVRGGGAYYMISRSLGPEFGGSIGFVFYIGQVLNSGMNVVGFIEPLLTNLGQEDGMIAKILPQGYWNEFIYSSCLLFVCICIALIGSQMVTKAGTLLFVLLLAATISVPISTIFVKPFEIPEFKSAYSGPSWITFKENLFPHFTKGAAGSLLKTKENFNDLFGIFFPATAGIFAGASMSGDLKKPSKSIPKGTLWGLLLTFCCYAIVILSLGCSVPRKLLHRDIQIIQTINLSGTLVLVGEFSTSLFSVIVGIVGAANVLQAIAKDSIFPGLKIFSKIDKNNNPINAIIFTWLLTQLCLFGNINQIATFITMAFLMTFIVTNLACFLLKIASAPNFRPSFRYFDWYTALSGGITSIIAMFIVDGLSATLVVVFLASLFLLIHYVCPPKPWGDVSQSLIYHQVRKYLLRLRQDNVKYWRPQILLLVDSPRSSWNLIQFCNHLKKGGLYILGHVIVSDSFQTNFEEFRAQKSAWVKLRDYSKVKAFVQIGLGPTLPWGVRNVFLGSGLGNMKPNITVIGYLDLKKHNIDPSLLTRPISKIDMERLPTDSCRNEKKITIQSWVQIIEDLILMHANVAVAKGFENLRFPVKRKHKLKYEDREYIDLYPIQMSAEVFNKNGEKSALTTNFDTYTLILQLGAILTTVPDWKKTHKLRIVVFIEDENDIENESYRIQSLLEVLRIKSEIKVICLGDLDTYKTIIKNKKIGFTRVNNILKDDEWWNELRRVRETEALNKSNIRVPGNMAERYVIDELQQRKYKLSKLQQMGVSFSMTTNKLFNSDIYRAAAESESDDDNESVFSESDLPVADNPNRFQEGIKRSKTVSYKSVQAHPSSESSVSNFYNNPTSKNPASTTTLNSALQNAKKKQRPNFSSQKIPRSKVIDDATGDEPSIMLVEDQIASKDDNNRQQSVGSSIDDIKSKGSTTTLNQTKECVPMVDINNLSFNDLPAKAQHIILNDLMKTVSKNSPLIFSTLPAPLIGTHYNEDDSKQYLENLQIWTDGLPPVLLINSQSMTVTTAL